MAGLAKGLAIIEAFGKNSGERFSIASAAKLTGQTRATARRCLLTLVELGYFAHDGKFFSPQPRLLRLGAAYLSSAQLPQIAQSLLDDIKRDIAESVTLTIPENDEMVVIVRSSIPQIIFSGDVPPQIRTVFGWNFPFMIPRWEKESSNEGIEVLGGADRVRFEAS